MSDVVDLTVLSGLMQETQRETRLMRLQMDNLVSRLTTVDQRVGVLEQAFHGMISEMSRGFSQQQQQIARLEQRLDGVDSSLTALRGDLASSTDKIIETIRGKE